MNKIITLTLNPAIDKSTTVAGVRPDRKLSCDVPVYEAGGGGINGYVTIRSIRTVLK